jgi:hypothetical protein
MVAVSFGRERAQWKAQWEVVQHCLSNARFPVKKKGKKEERQLAFWVWMDYEIKKKRILARYSEILVVIYTILVSTDKHPLSYY